MNTITNAREKFVQWMQAVNWKRLPIENWRIIVVTSLVLTIMLLNSCRVPRATILAELTLHSVEFRIDGAERLPRIQGGAIHLDGVVPDLDAHGDQSSSGRVHATAKKGLVKLAELDVCNRGVRLEVQSGALTMLIRESDPGSSEPCGTASVGKITLVGDLLIDFGEMALGQYEAKRSVHDYGESLHVFAGPKATMDPVWNVPILGNVNMEMLALGAGGGDQFISSIITGRFRFPEYALNDYDVLTGQRVAFELDKGHILSMALSQKGHLILVVTGQVTKLEDHSGARPRELMPSQLDRIRTYDGLTIGLTVGLTLLGLIGLKGRLAR